MKRVLLLMMAAVVFSASAQAGAKGGKTDGATTAAAPDDNSSEIHWLNIDEVQEKMKDHPKKVYMDIYTDWCGWCKRMEATTFKDPDVVKYMNANYYCVRFNAEQHNDVRFVGKMYHYDPQNKVNDLALELMGGHDHLVYPTAIYMDKMFQNPQPVPGYHDVAEMELITKYIGEGIYRTEKFEDYRKDFKPTWK